MISAAVRYRRRYFYITYAVYPPTPLSPRTVMKASMRRMTPALCCIFNEVSPRLTFQQTMHFCRSAPILLSATSAFIACALEAARLHDVVSTCRTHGPHFKPTWVCVRRLCVGRTHVSAHAECEQCSIISSMAALRSALPHVQSLRNHMKVPGY